MMMMIMMMIMMTIMMMIMMMIMMHRSGPTPNPCTGPSFDHTTFDKGKDCEYKDWGGLGGFYFDFPYH